MTELTMWGTPEDTFAVERADGGAGSPLQATLSSRPEAFTLTVRGDDVRVVVSHEAAVPGAQDADLDQAALAIDRATPGLLSCRRAGAGVVIEAVVYADGFGRHALNAAVAGIVKARRLLDARLEGARRVREAEALAQRLLAGDEEAARQAWAGLDVAAASTGPAAPTGAPAAPPAPAARTGPAAPTGPPAGPTAPAVATGPPTGPGPAVAFGAPRAAPDAPRWCSVTAPTPARALDGSGRVVGHLQPGRVYQWVGEGGGWVRVADTEAAFEGWVERSALR